MCGLYGYSNLTPITKQLTGILSLYMDARGNSAAGWTNGTDIIKGTGSIVDTFKMPEWDTLPFLAHCRAPSVGANTNENSHPFHWRGTKEIIGAHNGHVANWWQVRNKYSTTRSKAEVDSQMIIASLAEETSLGELDGWGTVVWFEKGQPGLFLSTFDRGDLAIAKLTTGEVVFASTESSIRKAVRFCPDTGVKFFYDVAPKFLYQIIDGDLYKHEKLTWGDAPLKVTNTSFPTGGTGNLSIFCKVGKCTKRLTKNDSQLVCDACFEGFLLQYLGEATAVGETQVEVWIA